MRTGRDLDALIAEKVMGWVWKKGAHYDVSSIPPDKQIHLLEPDDAVDDQIPGEFTSIGEWPPQDGRIIWSHLPAYSTDIAAAWQVVEQLGQRAWDFYRYPQSGNWRALVWAYDKELLDPPWVIGEAETAPLAICRAALQAVGVDL